MPVISSLRIPRWLHTQRKKCTIELHGFADASERAYAAELYLKTSIDGGRSTITLLSAKTKLAPIQRVSLPRLELNAAVLLTRNAARAQKILKLVESKVKLWTDSRVALAWIRRHPARWTTFVANRVAEIQRELPDAVWNHVASRDNPADCASRGLFPRELVDHSLWWQGPPWMHGDAPHATEPQEDDDIPKQRARAHVATRAEPAEPEILSRFSSLSRLLRVTAWCRRWLRVLRPHEAMPALTAQELEDAQWAWIRVTQAVWHADELRILSRREPLPRRSQLLCLSPILDEDRILRVGGRLKHAILSHDEQHSAILPRDSRLTTLIVEAFHKKTLHGGVQLTLAMICQKFWIPKGRALVRQCIHRCIPCVRWRAASPVPLMGSLPSPRVTISRAFTHTGVDYAGPILLGTSRGRGRKAYKGFIALFVCLSTRAVHLEAASDLTTDAFLAALRRFTARRGLCAAIYSDRGTNFVGPDKELRSFLRAAIMEDSY
ncbi:uncharacterized protein [Temnothorax longispinosus]|uniref:uncharacterized protein n=1 Tax=Temnothorax longispinosus TaxID=300112 RepID=UPI003A99935B